MTAECLDLGSWGEHLDKEKRTVVEQWCKKRYTDQPKIINVPDDKLEGRSAIDVARSWSQLSCEVCKK
jgi:hypothetical protein